jgi:hypothetical protein
MIQFLRDLFTRLPDIPLKDGSITHDPRLDRIVEFDERSRAFPIIMGNAPRVRPQTKMWTFRGRKLNQGVEGACTGFAAAHALVCEPPPIVGGANDAKFARETLYWQAQRDDPWPGGAYPGAVAHYEGTSMLAIYKTLVKLDLIQSYRHAFGEEDLLQGVMRHGPALVGTNWYSAMHMPGRNAVLKVAGRVVGGHAYVVRGYDNRMQSYRIINSWGAQWGQSGEAWISRKDMARLLRESGEAAFLIGKAKHYQLAA